MSNLKVPATRERWYSPYGLLFGGISVAALVVNRIMAAMTLFGVHP